MSTAQQVAAVERLVLESVRSIDLLAPTMLAEVVPALAAARDELRAELGAWLTNIPGGSERFTAYQKEQALRSIEASLDRVEELRPAMARALTAARETTGPLAVANLDTEIRRLSAIFGGGVPIIPQIRTAAILARGERMLWREHARSAARYAGNVGEDLVQMFKTALAKGETFERMVTRLRRLENPRARRGPIDPGADADIISRGLFQRYKHMADRLVRTEMMHAYNLQHAEAIEYANEHRPTGDEPFLRRWDASADRIVCPKCKALHGTVARIDGTFRFGIKAPPAHPYCRCVVLAWLERWGDMRGETPIRGEVPSAPPRAPRPRRTPAERPATLPESPGPAPAPRRAPATQEQAGALRSALGWSFGETRTTAVGPVAQDPTRRPAIIESQMLRRPGKRGVDVLATRLPPVKPAAPAVPPAAGEPAPIIWEKKTNPKRVAAAKKAAEASAERRREIHSAVASNLPQELQTAWAKEGHKFMQEQAPRIRGEKDRINAASRISEAFAEQYGSSETTHESDRYHRRMEIEAKHADAWADDQERKYYEAAMRAERQHRPAPRVPDDDDCPF